MKKIEIISRTKKKVIITYDLENGYTISVPEINNKQNTYHLFTKDTPSSGLIIWGNPSIGIDKETAKIVNDFILDVNNYVSSLEQSLPGYNELVKAKQERITCLDRDQALRQKSFDTSIYQGSVDVEGIINNYDNLKKQYPDTYKYISLRDDLKLKEASLLLNQITTKK